MIKKFLIIYGLMERADKKRLLLILCSSIINGLFSVVGIASILPFIGIISDPQLIDSNAYILQFKSMTGIETYQGIVIAFGATSFVLVVLGNLMNALDVWIGTRFGFEKEQALSKKLLSNYLHADELEFARKKNSERAKNILADIDRVILDSLFAMLEMVSSGLIALFIFILLTIVDFQATIVITVAIVVAYLAIYLFAAKRLDRLGREYADLETDIYSEVLEALKLHREIKMAQLQPFFIKRYTQSFAEMVNNRLKYELISLIPQRIIEVVAYGSILLIAIYFALVQQSNLSAITMIGMYAFAAYRLMPAISDIFDSYEQIQFGSAVLRRLVKEFQSRQKADDEQACPPLTQKLELSKVGFRFNEQSGFHFENLSIGFAARQFHCIIGKTGCGKSTLLNLIAGLYRHSDGEIFIDQKAVELHDNIHWQSQIGYVPPRVNLIEDTIAANIALGQEEHEIDRERMRQIASWVDIDDYIESLDDGYESVFGDEGFNFSTGQIQKIGIARALYRQPQVLLFDECTDALDIKSEALVLNNVLKHVQATIIFVSHRPSVHELADNVINLENLLQDSVMEASDD